MDKKYNKTIGIIAENLFINECTKRNISVFKNENDIGEIDYIILTNGETFRIQVKSTNTIKKNTCTISTKRTKNKIYTNIDIFACFIHPLNEWYLIPNSIVGERQSVCITKNDNKYIQFKNKWNIGKSSKEKEVYDRNIKKRNTAISLYKINVAKTEIARRLEVHYNVVNRWLRDAGYGIKKKTVKKEKLEKLYTSGKTMKEVANILGLTVWTTSKSL